MLVACEGVVREGMVGSRESGGWGWEIASALTCTYSEEDVRGDSECTMEFSEQKYCFVWYMCVGMEILVVVWWSLPVASSCTHMTL